MSSKVRYAVGVDTGSLRTRCVICAIEDNRIRFLGAGSVRSSAWQRGRLAHPEQLEADIQAAVREAETRSRVLVESVVVGIGGPSVEALQGHGLYELGRPREVTANDLRYVVTQASKVRLDDDRLLLHVLPQDFIVDGRAGYRYPLGMVCARIEVDVLLLTCSRHEHDSIINAAQQAHLRVDETMFEPLAASYAAVVSDERRRGVAVVDLGVDTTGVVVYDGDACVGAASLGVTAGHLTRDLTIGLRQICGVTVSYEDAETLKREYGCAMLGLTSDSTLIEVPAQEGRGSQEITRRQVNEILEARAEELFCYVRQEIVRAGMDQSLLEGVFLTGGGSRLNGMCDMAERILNCPAKFGLTVGIQDWPQDFQDPAWTTAAGLAMYSARLKLRGTGKKKPPGPRGLLGW
jgi:cell division protein FtsA